MGLSLAALRALVVAMLEVVSMWNRSISTINHVLYSRVFGDSRNSSPPITSFLFGSPGYVVTNVTIVLRELAIARALRL